MKDCGQVMAVILVAGAFWGCGDGSNAGAGRAGTAGSGHDGGTAGSSGHGGTAGAIGDGGGGAAGATLVAGSNGAAGATAAAGSNGAAGAAGATAAAGSNGAAGAAGATAAAGNNGAAGATAGSGGSGATVRAGCDPDWVTYDFTGTVMEASDPPTKSSRFAVGDPVTGYYCFDPATADVTESPGSTSYYFEPFTNELHGRPAPRFVFSLSLRDLVFTTNPKNLYSSINVTDGAGGDSYYVHPMEMLVNVAPSRVVGTDLFAHATNTSALVGTELVMGSLDMGRFDEPEIRVTLDASFAHARWDTLTRVR